MEVRRMASEIAKIEGKKIQTSIGNIREILKIAMILIGKDIINEKEVLEAECDANGTLRQLIKYGKRKIYLGNVIK